MQKASTQFYRTLPPAAFKSGTTDRGKEFDCYDLVKENLALILYFADHYCCRQRGTNPEFILNQQQTEKMFRLEITHSSISTGSGALGLTIHQL
jgi:IS30 family transposase